MLDVSNFYDAGERYLAAVSAFAPLEVERRQRFPGMGRRFGTLRGAEINAWPAWVERTSYEDAVDHLEAAEAALARRNRLAARLAGLDRNALAELASLAIDRLDAIDGDCDLEAEDDCCEAGDDGTGPVLFGGQVHWGSTHDEPWRR